MSVFGQLVFSDQGRGRAVPGRLYGLSVLRAEADPLGFWGERRLRKAGRGLLRGGARRVLVPRDFRRWPLLRQLGLVPVETEGLVRANCVPLALAALASQGLSPYRATVALRGNRAGGEMARAARELCPRVRCLVVDAPSGGEELARWLRREYGVPILPPGERGHLALRFQPGGPPREEAALDLYGPEPDLAGLQLTAPELAEGDREDLPLLAALWEGGKLGRREIKITGSLDRRLEKSYNDRT